MLLTSGSCAFIQKIRISKDQNYWKAFVQVYFVETTRANQSFEFLAGTRTEEDSGKTLGNIILIAFVVNYET